MLDRLRKRFVDLIGGETPAGEAPLSADELPARNKAPEGRPESPASRGGRQERESRLLLSERIHNRAAVLLGEVRTELLQEIHRCLDEETPSKTLRSLLEVTLDTAFTAGLNSFIEEITRSLLDKLKREFADDPNRDGIRCGIEGERCDCRD